MTLAEKIAAARAALVTTKDALTALVAKENLDASEVAQLEELSTTSERQANELAVLERAEKALAAGARPALPGGAGGAGGGNPTQRSAPAIATKGHLQRKGDGIDILVRSALIEFDSYCSHESVDQVVARRYPGDLQVMETSKLLVGSVVKGVTNPAMTNVAGWAAELVREGYGEFMDALAPESVVPRIPMQRYEFDGFGKIHLPSRANRYPTDPNLAAFFRAEGAPIRVGRTTTSTKYLTPKSAGVISTFTKELLKRSTPNIEEAIRQWMLEDTAIAMDTIFLDAVAGDAIRPAGIQNGIAAGDTGVSGGNTGQDIINDISARLKALSGHGMGRRPVWIMNQAHAWGLAFSKTPTGDSQFPEASNGMLAGIPIVASTTVPMDVVFLVDAAELGFAGGAPTFEGTDVATLHEDDGAPNTDGKTGPSVLPINAGVAAVPIRSLYQTHSAALKAVWELDWAVRRPGAVQTITGVGW